MVSAAVAGDDLQSVAGSASQALARPVAIALPALGAPVVWPAEASSPEAVQALAEHVAAAIGGEQPAGAPPATIADSAPIRIGQNVVGVVAALGDGPLAPDQRAWLEAAAAAAAVTALMRESQEGDLESSRLGFLEMLAARPVVDADAIVAQGRRLGFELGPGAVALCARWPDAGAGELPVRPTALIAQAGDGRVLALLPLIAGDGDGGAAAALAAELESLGLRVAISSPRRDPAALHEALREAELMLELAARPDAMLSTQEETYRLLIGVLLRDPGELELLRARTISPLASYDAEHDTELVATLQAFLAHHGSTTETAEAMQLHRHTVGYRLSRVHEVSGLSPYESDGRERLSLGLKAHQIIEAGKRRPQSE